GWGRLAGAAGAEEGSHPQAPLRPPPPRLGRARSARLAARASRRHPAQPRGSGFAEARAARARAACARGDESYTRARGGDMIFDLRIYTLHNNKFAAWLKLYDEYRSHEHTSEL